ncbi:hypothetical protein TNCV_3269321 [Trichonephila clavipes]|nr:hypothetical protein TNCV_3269321 [Trichonephila clavipes]
MVQDGTIHDAVFNVTEAIRHAADAAIPKSSNFRRKLCKPWWNSACQQAKKEQRRRWGIFRRYPTTDNLIAFKRAKALARKIRRQSQRESWIQYVFNHIVNYQPTVVEKGQNSEWPLSGLLFRYWKHRLLFTHRLLMWPT